MARQPTTLKRSEFVRGSFTHIAKHGETIDDVLAPSYWAHVAPQMSRFDIVEVIADDGSYEVVFRVISAEKSAMKFRVLAVWEPEPLITGLGPVDEPSPPVAGLSVTWGGPRHKWRVVDDVTKEVASHGHSNKEEAEAARDAIIEQRKAA